MANHYQPQDIAPLKFKDWASEEKPREKLIKYGAAGLTDAELLAILLGTGIKGVHVLELAKQILAKYDNSIGLVAKAGYKELAKIKGLGTVKAINIVTALELGTRRMRERDKRPVIHNAEDVVKLMAADAIDLEYEHFYALMLNNRNVVTEIRLLAVGNATNVLVDVRTVFRAALEAKATKIIVVHNHPSYTPYPSQSDVDLTRRMVEAGKLIGVILIDHIILAGQQHYSFADHNWPEKAPRI